MNSRPRYRNVDKSEIPVCNILGVNIAAVNMDWTVEYLKKHVRDLSGDYICVSNVHTTVTSYDDPVYRAVQNGGIMALPDGGPLSSLGRKRGFSQMGRVAGPDLMGEIFRISPECGFRHFFYGSTEDTLEKIVSRLTEKYPGIQIAGVHSPPFRPLTEEEDAAVIGKLNNTDYDFLWVGLGAPKQENWMAAHQGKVPGLMIGVGVGFKYYAGKMRRAPGWMQRSNLEWFYRLLLEPRRLFKRYFVTNTKFLWLIARGK